MTRKWPRKTKTNGVIDFKYDPLKAQWEPYHRHLLYSWVWPAGGDRGLEGKMMGAHLLHSASKTLAARRSNRPRAPLCSTPLAQTQVPYRWLTHFSSLFVLLPWENRVRCCVHEFIGWVGLRHWTKASHLHLPNRDECITRTPKTACHFLSETIACEIAS